LNKNVYLKSVFTRYTISQFDVVWLTGGESHPMVTPRGKLNNLQI